MPVHHRYAFLFPRAQRLSSCFVLTVEAPTTNAAANPPPTVPGAAAANGGTASEAAAGSSLLLKSSDTHISCHSIECSTRCTGYIVLPQHR